MFGLQLHPSRANRGAAITQQTSLERTETSELVQSETWYVYPQANW